MNESYNNFNEMSSKLIKSIKKLVPNIRKNQLKVLVLILIGMIIAESCVASDIAKELKKYFPDIQLDSLIKRIRRFFSNNNFDPYDFYKQFISSILYDFKSKHDDNNIFITFDHMFSKLNYTVLMFTMRVGTFGIPIWFKCFNNVYDNDAFLLETMEDGIKSVSNLFNNTNFNLIFLADRWFGSPKILSIIENLGHFYCIRIKGNTLVFDENGNKVKAKKLKHHKYHSTIHNDVFITEKRFKTNIVYSQTYGTNDPWLIATNVDTKFAIKFYSYRFGSIEMIFKAQKSNGFYLEKVSNASLESFTTMYTCVCTCLLYLTILGADFSKNRKCYKNVKITTHKSYNINGKKVKRRVMSLFNVGLTLFKLAFDSLIYIRIPVTFKLYDV